MRTAVTCFVSAILGSLFTVYWTESISRDTVHAQERRPRVRPTSELVSEETPPLAPLGEVFTEDGLTAEEAVNVRVYEAVNRSVVNITTKAYRGDRFLLLELQSEGSGSGAVLDRDGHILTNYHVVEDARTISVTLYNGESHEATLIGADPVNDIAVVRIEASPENLYPVTLSDHRPLRVGMRVFALGNPFGLERTLTTGIISSLNRSLQIHGNRTIKSIIQIDAAINPGNSGGPLLDARGQLIGINTAIATTTGQSAGVGFAIPVSLVRRVVPQILQHGRVIRPEIGITRVYQTEEGLLIAELKPNGPAEKAGLRGPKLTRKQRGPLSITSWDRSAADLIVGVDEKRVKTADDFLGYIEERRPGDEVQLVVVREGRKIQVTLTLGQDPGDGR